MIANVPVIQSKSESNPKDNERADKPHATRFVPPTLEEVSSYCMERGGIVDPQEFIDFYASKSWFVGKNKMTDWKAACRRAEKWDRVKTKPSDINAPPSMKHDGDKVKAEMDRLDRLLARVGNGD